VLTAAIAACGGGSNVTGGGGGGGGGGGCSGTNDSPALCDNHYSPATITVNHGQTLTFTWKGNNQHSVTSISAGLTMDSGINGNGHTFSHTFNEAPGTYDIECSVHGAAMTGTITIN
jgi:plastocyanin